MSVSFYLPHPVAVGAFMICRGLYACTEMWMCVLFWVYGKTQNIWVRCSALLCILSSILLVYSAGSGVNRVHVILSGFSMRLFWVFSRQKLYVCMVVYISWLHS